MMISADVVVAGVVPSSGAGLIAATAAGRSGIASAFLHHDASPSRSDVDGGPDCVALSAADACGGIPSAVAKHSVCISHFTYELPVNPACPVEAQRLSCKRR